MVEGAPKTETSQKEVPFDAQTAETLLLGTDLCISSPRRLRVRITRDERQAAVLGRGLGGGMTENDRAVPPICGDRPPHRWYFWRGWEFRRTCESGARGFCERPKVCLKV